MFRKASAPSLFQSSPADNSNDSSAQVKRSSVGGGMSTGLFGNSASPSNLSSIFSSQPSNPAPFGNANSLVPQSSLGIQAAPTSFLSGNGSAANNATPSIFGNSANKSNLSQTGSSLGPFGSNPTANSSMPTKPSLFGASAPNTSTFGSSATSSSNMFSNSFNQQPSVPGINVGIKSNPYDHDRIAALANQSQPPSSMPGPISSSSLLSSANEKPFDDLRKRSRASASPRSEISHSHPPKHTSLLSKLGKSFNIFRFSHKHEKQTAPDNHRGVFSAPNYLKMPETAQITQHSRFDHTLGHSNSALRPSSGRNRLIVRSKPIKFHLIDANRVLARKANRVIDHGDLTDDEDAESDSAPHEKRQKISMAGRSVRASDAASSSSALMLKPEAPKYETTDGYWCSPSISSIESMTTEQLKSVTHFIVQRRGYGQIFFRHPVDLTRLVEAALAYKISLSEMLFGNVIRITTKSIEVFMNMSYPLTKDDIGEGLNRPATLTMEGIAPLLEKSTTFDFIERLRRMRGQSFVSYDPIGKIWVYTVEHFSVWGLLDDEDEDYAHSAEYRALVDLKRKQDANEAEARAKSAAIYGNTHKRNQATPIAKHEHTESRTVGVPGLWNAAVSDPREAPLYSKQDTVAQEIRDQINLFNQEKSYNGVNLGVSDITIDSDHSDTDVSVVFGESTPPLTADENDLDHLRQLVSLLPRDVDMAEIVDEKAYEPAVEDESVFKSMLVFSDVPTSKDWLVQLELANDVGSSVNPLLGELSESANYTTFGAVDDFLFPSYDRKALEKERAASSSPLPNSVNPDLDAAVTRPIPIDSDIAACSHNVPSLIALILERAKISIRDNGFPIVTGSNSLSFAMLLGAELGMDERALLSLCSVLFDDHVDDMKESEEVVRRRHLGEWLVKYNEPMVKEMLVAAGENQMQKTFVYLLAGDLTNAIAYAQKVGQGELAAILTLLDANDAVVESIARKQLESWSLIEQGETDSAIRHIYELLAGDLAGALSQLPWNGALALNVLYGDTRTRILDIASQFRTSAQDDGATKQDRPCAIEQVLGLYADMQGNAEEALIAFSRGCLNPKMTWLIYKVVTGTTSTPNHVLDALSDSFGDCLAAAGWWVKSVFVYSHDSRDDVAKSQIRQLVIDHVGGIEQSREREAMTSFKAITYGNDPKATDQDLAMAEDNEMQQYRDEPAETGLLVDKYRVPRSLIDEAIAIHHERLGDWWGQCEALIRAQLWPQAHITVVEYLGPELVILNTSDVRERLRQILGRFAPQKASIRGWKQGAGLYDNFIKLVDNDSPHAQLEAVDYLMENLPLASNPTRFEQGVGLRLMSRRVADIALERKSNRPSADRIMSLKLGQAEREYLEARLAATSA